MVHPNSNEALRVIQPELSKREAMVLDALRALGKATMHEVADSLGVGVNTISGRFTALVRIGKIKVSGRKHYTHEYEDGTTRKVPRSIFEINIPTAA